MVVRNIFISGCVVIKNRQHTNFTVKRDEVDGGSMQCRSSLSEG